MIERKRRLREERRQTQARVQRRHSSLGFNATPPAPMPGKLRETETADADDETSR
jgi:hypothetical protein